MFSKVLFNVGLIMLNGALIKINLTRGKREEQVSLS